MLDQPLNEGLQCQGSSPDYTPQLPYQYFQQVQQVLANVEAADYFLAKEVCTAILSDIDTNKRVSFTQAQQSLLFHVVIALSQSVKQGHTCLPISVIAGQHFATSSDIDGFIIHQGYIFPAINIIESLLVELAITDQNDQVLVFHQQQLYLRRYFSFECQLANDINQRNVNKTAVDDATITLTKQAIDEVYPVTTSRTDQENSNTNSSSTESVFEIDWQKVAIANALNKQFSIIAGGPGTGKTYTVTKLLAASVALQQKLNNKPINFALVAPTGKAAQRLSESIQQAITQFKDIIADDLLAALPTQALTIHRLLGYIPGSPNFRHHQDNLLNIDFLLIDEASMVDLALLTRIFRALPSHCKVVLLGDADQLPSVAVGNVLADLAPRPHSGYSPENQQYLQAVLSISPSQLKASLKLQSTTKLKNKACDYLSYLYKSRRFDGEGGIGKLAKYVIAGDAENSWLLLNENSNSNVDVNALSKNKVADVALINNAQLTDIYGYAQQYYQAIFTSASIDDAFALLNQFRILCATRQGAFAVESINEAIEQYFIKQGDIPVGQKIYHGMPIMVTENNHRLGIYNGDVGLIWQDEEGHLMAFFEDAALGYRRIIPSRLPRFELVFAMTIHKTQGSEFTHVLMVLPQQSEHKLLSRELLYTGITRAKKTITVATQQNIWQKAVNQQVNRHSRLATLVNNEC